MMNYVHINGAIVSREDAKISINDLALLRGYGVFDYFKTVNGQPVWLQDHMQRLFFSAREMFLDTGHTPESLTKQIQELSAINGMTNCGTRITITGGYSEDGYNIGRPNLMITQDAFSYNPAMFSKGTRLLTYQHQRQLSHIKTIDYLQAIRLQGEIKAVGADDVLYKNESGMLRECPRSNFYIVCNGKVVTPATGVLAGVTRKNILSLAGVKVIQKDIHQDELSGIDEAFISSTSKIILPVLQIDGKLVGNGKPGKMTRMLWEKLLALQGI